VGTLTGEGAKGGVREPEVEDMSNNDKKDACVL
jgi:hypothetical protein